MTILCVNVHQSVVTKSYKISILKKYTKSTEFNGIYKVTPQCNSHFGRK